MIGVSRYQANYEIHQDGRASGSCPATPLVRTPRDHAKSRRGAALLSKILVPFDLLVLAVHLLPARVRSRPGRARVRLLILAMGEAQLSPGRCAFIEAACAAPSVPKRQSIGPLCWRSGDPVRAQPAPPAASVSSSTTYLARARCARGRRLLRTIFGPRSWVPIRLRCSPHNGARTRD